MSPLILLIIAVSVIATPKCAKTPVSNVVKDLNQVSPTGTKALAIDMYKRSLLENDVKPPSENRTEAIRNRLNKINNSTVETNKTQLVLGEITKINSSITLLSQEAKLVNESIIESQKKIKESQKSDQSNLKSKLEEIAKEKQLMDSLYKKKEELRLKQIELMRLKEEAQRILEVQAEQMRQRRRFIDDLYNAKKEREATKVALDRIKDVEFNKTLKTIEKSGNISLDLRNQNRAIELKERAFKLKQDKMAEVLRRKMLIVQEQIKTAKIQRNEELKVQLEKQLIELKRYKKAKIQCARNALRKYKLLQRKKIEDLKQKVLDAKLINKLSETKNDYISKIKAQLADEIDDLKKDKTVFESEKTIAHKKIENELKIEAHRLKAAQHAQKRKNYEHEINRKEMAKMRKAVARAEIEQLERKATKSILRSVIRNVDVENQIDRHTTNKITAMQAELANRKTLLEGIALGVKNTTDAEKKEIEDLKNKAIKAKQQRQIYKTQIARDILVDAHNRHLVELKEKKAEIDAFVNSTIANRNRKSALKMNKAKSMISLAGLQGKLDKKYILKRQQVALKNSKAFSDAVKRLLPKQKEHRLKLKTFKPKCGKLAKKMSTPCSKSKK
ncbi:DNA double-strand break repair Rad50 ATPase [Entamoeba marina]